MPTTLPTLVEIILQPGEEEWIDWDYTGILRDGDTIDTLNEIRVERLSGAADQISLSGHTHNSALRVQAFVSVDSDATRARYKLTAVVDTVGGGINRELEGLLRVVDV